MTGICASSVFRQAGLVAYRRQFLQDLQVGVQTRFTPEFTISHLGTILLASSESAGHRFAI